MWRNGRVLNVVETKEALVRVGVKLGQTEAEARRDIADAESAMDRALEDLDERYPEGYRLSYADPEEVEQWYGRTPA